MKLMEIEKDFVRFIYLYCVSSVCVILSVEVLICVGYENVIVIICNVE